MRVRVHSLGYLIYSSIIPAVLIHEVRVLCMYVLYNYMHIYALVPRADGVSRESRIFN
jgi:hypothetical protein